MKMIYLDQCKWIDLAKAETGRADGERFLTVLGAARTAVSDGRACFPLSRTHLIETARAPRKDQRETIARLMAELSNGVVIRTTQRLTENGIKEGVRKLFGLRVDEVISPFGRGFEDTFGFDLATMMPGRSPEFVQAFRGQIDTPEKWIEVLTSSDEAARIAGVNSTDMVADNWLVGCELDREQLKSSTTNELRSILCARATDYFQAALIRALSEIGRTVEEWGAIGPNRLVEFWNEIPCFRAQAEYELALLRDKEYEHERNDLRDIGFLGPAVPYCDVVVAERQVTGILRGAKLDKLFGTVLLTDLVDLERLLGKQA